ncbi:MAG: pilus assembly protein, partial [Gemmatimonadales bacterium]|nr:pilus assembly protein [Gemmatimonadales bacterium]
MVGWFGKRREDRGAALVEAALVMPLLLMLTLGIWATARAWNVHNVLDHASREAARFGAV